MPEFIGAGFLLSSGMPDIQLNCHRSVSRLIGLSGGFSFAFPFSLRARLLCVVFPYVLTLRYSYFQVLSLS